MEDHIKEKLNALAMVAKADGHFAETEKELLREIASGYGKNDKELQEIIDNPQPIGNMDDLSEHQRLEFIFIAIKIMRADEIIHDSEVNFCKSLASKLNINEKIVDEYATVLNFDFTEFLKKGKKYIN